MSDRGFATGPDPLPATQYIDMRDAIIAGLKQDIATLQSQLQSVTAERDAAQQQVGSLTFQRDALSKTLNQWIFEASDRRIALEAARQSRARLVRLVRELQDWRTLAYKYHRICLKAESERDAARKWAAAWRKAAIEYRSQVRMFKAAIKDNAWHSEYRRTTRAAARRFAETADARRAAEAMDRR